MTLPNATANGLPENPDIAMSALLLPQEAAASLAASLQGDHDPAPGGPATRPEVPQPGGPGSEPDILPPGGPAPAPGPDVVPPGDPGRGPDIPAPGTPPGPGQAPGDPV